MTKLYYNDLIIKISRQNIKIVDSYKIKNKSDMKKILQYIFDIDTIYNKKRNMNSLIREWRTHNILYKYGLFVNHTKDCDLESNERLYRRFFYNIFGRF